MLIVNNYIFSIALTEQVFKRNCISILPRHLAMPTQEKERGCLNGRARLPTNSSKVGDRERKQKKDYGLTRSPLLFDGGRSGI